MVQARSAKGRKSHAQEEPERIAMRFEFPLVGDLDTRIKRYAVRQPIDAQRGLHVFLRKLIGAIKRPGHPVFMDAPAGAWHWLIKHAVYFAPEFCREVVVQLSAHEEHPERDRARREQAENDAELKKAADELRAREAAIAAGLIVEE